MTLPEETKTLFQSMREGILIIDAQTKILFANRSYLEFLGNTEAEILGRPLREIRPGARLPEVLSTGSPILHAPRAEKNDDVYFVNMYPILQHGAVTGGISIVTFMRDAYDFRAELEAYEKRSRQVLHRVNKVNSTRYTFDSIVAVDENVQAVKALAQKAAATDAAVLLASESGTGKELYAQAIHNASSRRGEVFVAINSADGGTLFLDEVSEMDMGLQAKLLRAIQEGLFRPVGGVQELETDVRIISASNADLQKYIESGRFRRDLFYRLSTFQIRIPPLRERRADIPVLAQTILSGLAVKLKRRAEISPEALECLTEHNWPGNVRELRNVLEASVYLSADGLITPDALPEHILRRPEQEQRLPLGQRVRAFERAEIQKVLQRHGNTLEGKKRAAAELGISLATLYNKLGHA